MGVEFFVSPLAQKVEPIRYECLIEVDAIIREEVATLPVHRWPSFLGGHPRSPLPANESVKISLHYADARTFSRPICFWSALDCLLKPLAFSRPVECQAITDSLKMYSLPSTSG
jgi:hypothetical protein